VRWDRSGEGRPIVLVHGTPWSSFNLRHLIEGQSADHSVYFFDLLGYGQSSMVEGDVSLGIQNEVLDHLLMLWELVYPVVNPVTFSESESAWLHGSARRECLLPFQEL